MSDKLAIALVAILPFACVAATYYVKPDGNDSAAGTSWETALKTVNKGFSKIHNNNVKDKLIIGRGHYLLSDACACAGGNSGDEVRGVDMGCYELFVPSGLFISFR